MKQFRRPISFYLSASLALFFLLSICCFPSVSVVYALPGALVTGWVEVRCDPIPQDFSETATIVLSNTETEEYYTITCHKINEYIGRMELPVGKYRVEQTSTADNFAYEASTTVDTFEITAEMPAAQLITMNIVKHDVSYELPITDAGETIAAPDSTDSRASAEENESDATSSVGDTQDTSNSILDWLTKETSADEAFIAEDMEFGHSDEETEQPSGGRVVMIVLGTILFIIIIMVIAYFARQHFERE